MWFQRRVISFLCGFGFLLLAIGSAEAQPTFTFADGTLTIRTDRYEVQWRDGAMVAMRSFLPAPTEWTGAAETMGMEQLPNGVGSFHERDKEAKEQHHPWGTFPLTTTFPAQHPPCADSLVKFEQKDNLARLTYSNLNGDEGGVLVQEFLVEEGTGDLVIRQEGSSPHPGVFGVAFSILNLKPEIEWIMPYFGGQRWGADFRKGKLSCIAWPEFWSAGLIVGTAPSGAVCAVWSEDPDMRPKFFRRWNGEKVQGIGFEACNDAPFDDKKRIKAFPWRFNTFGTSWMAPAQRYKDWMIDAYRLVPRKERASGWVDDIALIWPAFRGEDDMKTMAETFDPKKTLMMNWGWLKGFNRRIPEYIPMRDTFAQDVALAHRHGYRVGVYTSMALVDVEAHSTIMKDYGLDFFYRALFQDRPTEAKSWLVYVHPGRVTWRDFYRNKMAEVVREYGVDYLYQDVAGCAVGSSGIIEGRTFSAAVVACEEAIRAKVPKAALGGEYWNEVNACQEDFGVQCVLSWGGEEHKQLVSRPSQPHPLLSYLFSDYCVYWPHRITIRDTEGFHRDLNIREVIGAIPVWTTDPDDRISEARVVLERARLWADGFRPYFPAKWDPQAVSYARSADGRVVKYIRRGESTFCLAEADGGDRLRYARLKGLTRVEMPEPVTIDGWIAYGPKGPIGLDPARWYCVFPGAPESVPIDLTRLPEGGCIETTRLADDYYLIGIGGKGSGEIEWHARQKILTLHTPAGPSGPAADRMETELPTSLLFVLKAPQPIPPSDELPLNQWHHNLTCAGRILKTIQGKDKRSIKLDDETHPAYTVMPPLGGNGSEYSIDGLVSLPNRPGVRLHAYAGLFGGTGDGVHFVVRVNGREIWRQYRETKRGWQEVTVPLSDYAGRTLVLSLAVDCGKTRFNTSCDTSLWGDPKVLCGE